MNRLLWVLIAIIIVLAAIWMVQNFAMAPSSPGRPSPHAVDQDG